MRIIRSQPPYAMGSHQTPDWFQVHGILTPAGFSASSVEKYHYALHMSSPIGCFPGYRRINVVARFFRKVLAHLRLRLVIQGTYLMLDYSVFKVWRRLSEVPPYITPPTDFQKTTNFFEILFPDTERRKEKAEIVSFFTISAWIRKG